MTKFNKFLKNLGSIFLAFVWIFGNISIAFYLWMTALVDGMQRAVYAVIWLLISMAISLAYLKTDMDTP